MIMRYRKTSRWISALAFAMVATIGVLTLPNEAVAQEQPAGGSSANLDQKLESVILSLDFNNASLQEAFQYLNIESKHLDPSYQKINFVIQPEALKSAEPISLALNKVSLGDALRNICKVAHVKFKMEDNTIRIVSFTQNVDNPISQSSGSERAIEHKLQSIIIDKVNLDKLDVATVLQLFTQKSRELDPDKVGVNFVLGNITPQDHVHREVTIVLQNVPFTDILQYVRDQTHLQYSIEDNAVYFRP